MNRNLLYLFLLSVVLFACRKEDNIIDDANAKLSFSEDSILFDTVFTTIGSITKQLKIYNPYDGTIEISKISLAGGNDSEFRMNVDGVAGVSFDNIKILPKDSIYIFVEVTVDPNNANSPLVIKDSIIFNTTDNQQDVDLIAWGQDAHYILGNRQLGNFPYLINIVAEEYEETTWVNDKPYVVYGWAVVDSNAVLNIEAGCRIHFHKNSSLWIYSGGVLKVNGQREAPVIFQGDRLDPYYSELPGQWDRILINEGPVDSEINYAIIKNGFIGLQTEWLYADMGNSLKVSNTIIENMTGVGIYARSYRIDAENLLVSNSQQQAIALIRGGDYEFRHTTIANYWSYSSRDAAALLLSNYYIDPYQNLYYYPLERADFKNTIVYGGNEEELALEFIEDAGWDYHFMNCLLRTKSSLADQNYYTNCLKNQNPGFKDVSALNFHLTDQSSILGAGDPATAIEVPYDLDGIPRDASTPDIGAYEFIAK